jgi:hypothetical protein
VTVIDAKNYQGKVRAAEAGRRPGTPPGPLATVEIQEIAAALATAFLPA